MRRVYGLDTYEELKLRRMRPRSLAACAANLPDGSMVWRRLGLANAWTAQDYLTATLVEQMNMWMWANSDPKKRGQKPKPVPRPGNATRTNSTHAGKSDGDGAGVTRRTRHIETKAVTVDELDRFMSQHFTTIESG